MATLYMRMASLAASVIRSIDGHENDLILVGAVHRTIAGDGKGTLVSGAKWVDMCYQVAEDSNWSIFWDGVSVHPYQDDGLPSIEAFDPARYEFDADTLRKVMRHHNDPGGELWNTEIGWDTADGSSAAMKNRARNLVETFVATKVSETRPSGRCDRAFWWMFRNPKVGQALGNCTLVDSTMDGTYPAFWAFQRMTGLLTGKRFDRRVMAGDTAVDNHTRMYEFEDPGTLRRTWVCWKNGGLGPGTVSTKLPVQTGRLVGESLAYSSRTPKFSPKTSNDGWLRLNLDERPVFITEIAEPSRPDLRVDSVRYKQGEGVVRAWVTNHGNAPTPLRSGRRAYPTAAVLNADGDSMSQAVWTESIGINQGAEFGFELGRTELPDTVLLSVTVNPSQTFVELETDDNTGYTLKVGR